ncbi:MAG TPA: SDR family oxidoreductase [Nitrolancea sp.]|jgi:NAD(P)-dependent dehydrogenase (short-subunit alcohol dehydrogenase family)|nr:SDR family oxidoreductase [Nitrolancea sp.]
MGILDGKVAVVTGAGRGIGRGVALLMAQEGAAVVVNDLGASLDGEGVDTGPAATVVSEIKASGGQAVANTDSVTDYQAAEGMIQQAIDNFGKFDILVNVAGILRDRMVFNMTEEEWKAVIDVHLKGTFNTCRWAAVRFREQRSGRMINFSSTSAFGAPGQPNYAAAKAGIIGLTLSCAAGLARYNVTANAILPSGATRMIDSIPRARDAVAHTGKLPSELAIGTERDPNNVAPLIVFLASDASQPVTGHVFGSFGYNYAMISQPKIIKSLRSDHRLTVDELSDLVPKAFGPELESIKSESGFSRRIDEEGEGKWVDVGNGLRFWGTELEPYGELVW